MPRVQWAAGDMSRKLRDVMSPPPRQGRNLEGWMNEYNLDVDAGLPWFKLSSSFKDSAEVGEIVEGNFAVSWIEGDEDAGPLPQVGHATPLPKSRRSIFWGKNARVERASRESSCSRVESPRRRRRVVGRTTTPAAAESCCDSRSSSRIGDLSPN